MRIMNVPISSISELKKSPMDVIHTAEQSGNGVYILNRNRAVAVLLTAAQYERLVANGTVEDTANDDVENGETSSSAADQDFPETKGKKSRFSKSFILDLLGEDAVTAPSPEKICRYIEKYARETKETLTFLHKKTPVQFFLNEDLYKAELRQSMLYGGSYYSGGQIPGEYVIIDT